MTDIRELLQNAKCPSTELDIAIGKAIGGFNPKEEKAVHEYSTDYTGSIDFIEGKGYDWIIANVNGQFGGTPFACVGVPESKASYSATPLLSLWLSYFRLELGDERPDA